MLLAVLIALAAQGEPAVASVSSVAVMPLVVKGKVDKGTVAVIDQLILAQLQATVGGSIRVVGKSDIDALLGFHKTKDSVGCNDTTCATELAFALGVDSIMTGTISLLGNKVMLSLAWIQQRDGRPLGRITQDLGTDENGFDAGLRTAIAAVTGVARAPTAARPPNGPDLTGWWRWACRGNDDSGYLLLRQTGNRVTGLVTDMTAGSGGAIEGTVEGASLRFVRRIPGAKVVQDYRMVVAADGGSAQGQLDGAMAMEMTRDASRLAGKLGEGITGTYRWDSGANFGTVVLVQSATTVTGIVHDERVGSGGFLEGTLVDGRLELRRTIRRSGEWQIHAYQRSGQGFSGSCTRADGGACGQMSLTPLED